MSDITFQMTEKPRRSFFLFLTYGAKRLFPDSGKSYSDTPEGAVREIGDLKSVSVASLYIRLIYGNTLQGFISARYHLRIFEDNRF